MKTNVTSELKSFVVQCPACGYDYAHFQRVYPINSSYYESATGAHTSGSISDLEEKRSQSQSALAIEYEGECGHRFRLLSEQHKGQEFVSFELLSWVPVTHPYTNENWPQVNHSAEKDGPSG